MDNNNKVLKFLLLVLCGLTLVTFSVRAGAVTNLALSGSALASSMYSADYTPDLAFDGDPNTRWASKFSDPQWLQVDLGALYTINRVVLNWATSSRAYTVETSLDGAAWTTVFLTTAGDGGVVDIVFSETLARYVRMVGTSRNTPWDHSLREFEVYGVAAGGSTPELTRIEVSPADTVVVLGETWPFTATAFDQYGDPMGVAVNWSVDGGVIGSDGVYMGTTLGGPFTVTAQSGGISGTATVSVVDTVPVDPTRNLALSGSASASSMYSADYTPDLAFDGDPNTRWASKFSDPQWLQVDLGALYTINRVVLNWATSSRAYTVETSLDGAAWTTVFLTTAGDGGVVDIVFSETLARYVRMVGTSRNTPWDHSLSEFEVYGVATGGSTPELTRIEVSPADAVVAIGGTWPFTATAFDQYGDPMGVAVNWSVDGGVIGSDGVYMGTTLGGPFTVTAQSGGISGTATVSVVDTVPVDPTRNLALSGSALASSMYSADYTPDLAFDGDPNTRWASKFSDPQWLQVDLGALYTINRVVLNWATSSRAYTVETSLDGAVWTTVFLTTAGDGGVVDIVFSETLARYVRMVGTSRNTPWDHSLSEFEVYGVATGGSTPELTRIEVSPADAVVAIGGTWPFTATAFDQYGDPMGVAVNWSVDGGVIGSDGVYMGTTLGGPFTVTAQSGGISGTATVSVVDTVPVDPTLNLALSSSAAASSMYSADYTPDLAFDGDPNTRWASKFSDPQWLQVDLGALYTINRVVLNWATSSRAYTVETSLDGAVWTTVYSTAAGDGGVVDIVFSETLARYVRMVGTSRNTPWDHSLKELEVYGVGAADTQQISSCIANPEKIMLIGNSITQANKSYPSYRRNLWFNIRGDNFAVNFVGSTYTNSTGPNPQPDFDLDHEGHAGWRADEILAGLPDWLLLNVPDIALIHLGTNDIFQAQSNATTINDLEDIISNLRAANPNVVVLLAQLIPLSSSFNAFISDLNNEIPVLANSMSTPGSPVIVVDQNTGFVSNAHTFDGIHPNELGEKRMADVWYASLKPVLQEACLLQ